MELILICANRNNGKNMKNYNLIENQRMPKFQQDEEMKKSEEKNYE